MNRRTRALLAALAVVAGLLIGVPRAAAAALPEPPSVTRVNLPEDSSRVLYDEVRQKVYVQRPEAESVAIVNLDGTVVREVPGMGPWTELVMSGDGETVFVLPMNKDRLVRIDTRTYATTTVPFGRDACTTTGTFTGGRLWIGYFDCDTPATRGLATVDPRTGVVTDSGLAVPGSFSLLSPSIRPDRLVLTDYRPEAHHVYDVSGEAAVEVAVVPTTRQERGLIPLPGGLLAEAPGGDGPLTFRDERNPADAITVEGHDPQELSLSPDGRYLVVQEFYGQSGAIAIRDLAGGVPGALMRKVNLPGRIMTGSQVFAAADGRVLATGRDLDNGARYLYVLDRMTSYDPAIEASVPAAVGYREAFTLSGAIRRGPTGAVTLSVTRADRSGTRHSTLTTAADGSFSLVHDPGTTTGPVRFTLEYAGDAEHEAATWTGTAIVRPVGWDFNADGFADTVVGTPNEDDGAATDTGQFHVFYGGASGTAATGSVAMDQNTPGLPGSNEPGDRLGHASASGDFNGDGFADLAVSAPNETDGSQRDAGMVMVLFGSPAGLSTQGATSLWQTGDVEAALLGWSLAAGDFDNDGRDDLVAGAPGAGAGVVHLFPGGESGPDTVYILRQGADDVPGTEATGDRFGWSVAVGDVNGDGNDELAVGVPGDGEDKGWSTGAVLVYQSGAGGLRSAAQRITKETPGVPGSAGKYEPRTGDGADEFGLKVVLADFNGDGKDDLAASAPGSAVNGVADAGTVTVLYSEGDRIGTQWAFELSQDTPGIVGLPGENDFFGDNIAAGDSNGDGVADLAVFSYGDDYLSVIPGSVDGLAYGKSVWWSQDSPGIPGSQEAGDKWGASLRFLTGAKPALLVGAPGEDNRQGAFTVVYIGSNGLTGEGAQYFGEGTPGVPGEPENGDRFGTF